MWRYGDKGGDRGGDSIDIVWMVITVEIVITTMTSSGIHKRIVLESRRIVCGFRGEGDMIGECASAL